MTSGDLTVERRRGLGDQRHDFGELPGGDRWDRERRNSRTGHED